MSDPVGRRAWEVTAGGMAGIAFATTPGEAKGIAWRFVKDVGYGIPFTALRCRRAPQFDALEGKFMGDRCYDQAFLEGMRVQA